MLSTDSEDKMTAASCDSDSKIQLSSETSDSSIEHLLRRPGKLTDRGYGLNEYDPGIPVFNRSLARVKPGIVLKFPHHPWWLMTPEQVAQMWIPISAQSSKHKFEREKRVFEILGDHPRIVRCLGIVEEHRSILLAEANGGDLDEYFKAHGDRIDMSLRFKWRSQAAEAIEFIHKHGIYHFDLRPHNILVHTDSNDSVDLLLCDFGFASLGEEWPTCGPTSGFFDPTPRTSQVHQDLFGLGSIFFYIMTGVCPYASHMLNETAAEENAVLDLIRKGEFPSVNEIVGGSVILNAWKKLYPDAGSLIHDQDQILAECEATLQP